MYLAQGIGGSVSAGSGVLLLRTAHEGAAIADLAGLGSTLGVKEWTKALSSGCTQTLARTNAAVRGIDLACNLGAPTVVGGVMTYADTAAGAGLIAAWFALAWVPQCLLLAKAHAASPALRKLKPAPQAQPSPLQTSEWAAYCRQPCLPAALCLAGLYFTVLNFGMLMTAYLRSRGLSELAISGARGAGALGGIAGTACYPLLHARVGTQQAGSLGLVFQWAMLTAVVGAAGCAAAGLLQASGVAYTMIGCLVMSRLGLYVFDLAAGQLLQEQVDDKDMGAVNGVQGSLQQVAQLMVYALGMAFGAPSQFPWLMVASWTAVTGAALMYCVWASRQPRAHQPASPMLKQYST